MEFDSLDSVYDSTKSRQSVYDSTKSRPRDSSLSLSLPIHRHGHPPPPSRPMTGMQTSKGEEGWVYDEDDEREESHEREGSDYSLISLDSHSTHLQVCVCVRAFVYA
jgi:hypothetical protein